MTLHQFNKIDEYARQEREDRFSNKYYCIDDLPLTPQQKKSVVEYLARKLWSLLLDTNIQDGHCKSYDPLMIDDGEAHSYVFDMEDGGRHHKYKNLKHLEEMIYAETLDQIKNAITGEE